MAAAKENGSYITVQGLPSSTPSAMLKAVFRSYGKILGVKQSGSHTEVYFEQVESAMKAGVKSNGAIISGKKIVVQAGVAQTAATPAAPKTPTRRRSYKLCEKFLQGSCPRGDSCRYMHQVDTHDALGDAPEVSAPKVKSTDPAPKVKSIIPKVKSTAPTPAPAPTTPTTPTTEDHCAECEVQHSAVACVQCQVSFCTSCDTRAHQSKVMSRHIRSLVIVQEQPTVPNCAECTKVISTVHCESCDAFLCSKCAWSIHAHKVLRRHKRIRVEDMDTESFPVQNKKLKGSAPALSTVVTPLTTTSLVISTTKVQSKKLSVSSESESESESPQTKPMPVVKQPLPPVSASSSESESESEPEMESLPVSTSKPTTMTKQVSVVSSESESSESEDDEEPAPVKTQIQVTTTPPVNVSESSDSSESESDEEVVVPTTTTPKKRSPFQQSTGASMSSKYPNHSVVKIITAYATDSSLNTALDLSPNLNSFERLLAHDCAERLGLMHTSMGDGTSRHLQITK